MSVTSVVSLRARCAHCDRGAYLQQVQLMIETGVHRWTKPANGWWLRPTFDDNTWGLQSFCSESCVKAFFASITVERMSLQVRCAHCEAKDFGLHLRLGDAEADDEQLDRCLLLPAEWWQYPVDHGDRDGDEDDEGVPMLMLHAWCSEACIHAAIKTAFGLAVPATPRPASSAPKPPPYRGGARDKAPLTATLGEMLLKRT